MQILSEKNLNPGIFRLIHYSILVLFLIILFFITSPLNCESAVLLDRVVATVNDEIITWSELTGAIMMQGGPIPDKAGAEERKKRIKQLERPVLNELINLRLQLQEARRLGLDVGEAEVDGSIDEIKKTYNLTDKSLKASLEAEGLTMKEYRSSLRDRILFQRTVNFAVRSKIVITDKAIKEYYEKNKDLYQGQESLKIRQIFFKDPKVPSARSTLFNKAKDIVNKIRAGKDFAELAREFSEGPEKEYGGELGYIEVGTARKEIEDKALSLKTGEVSDPFWSPAGLHIIKLEDRKSGGGLDQARDRIREKLFQEAFQSKYRQWTAGLREKAYIEIKL